ncbi:hypothetical protein GPECTOR_16g604 [Gonium pectorale]|uniref:Uncharacterized protein n=1 Tax=Gonium pectorale TaxID=33097 RepID=A0A150GM80_GONPE|nr:hypothetical protein GPECTOR_16g604 [Gonium pectorale]|eukprot:KXZ50430.1 hypothetical protein GPECTOR_16g604 [Gonium pectorale]
MINLVVATGSNPYISQLSAWSLAGWSAVALYDCNSKPALDLGIPRRPIGQRILRNRNRALAAALLRLHSMVDPVLGGQSRAIMAAAIPKGRFQLEPSCNGSTSSWDTPECVGIKAAEETYKWMQAAGWNYDGARSRQYNKSPFTDYTGLTPKNTPWDLKYPCSWQPLHETDGRGKVWIQSHLVPYAPNVSTFFVGEEDASRPLDFWKCDNATVYKEQVDEVIATSAALDDRMKMIAETFGPQPFTLQTMLKLRDAKKWALLDLMAFGLVNVIQIDLQISVILRNKIKYSSVRPASAVRYLYGTKNITAYARGVGKATYPAKDWLPYVGTYNEGEFPSGAVCWCTVLNEWITAWQGGDDKHNPPISWTYGKGCSLREPFTWPTKDTTFSASSAKEFIALCKDARVWGGSHFRVAVEAGQQACTGVVANVWDRIKALYPRLGGKKC